MAKMIQFMSETGEKQYPATSSEAVGMSDGSGNLDAKLAELDNKVSTQLPAIEEAKNEALNNIKENEQSAITNFNSQRVTPEMLSESTKQLIEASGGGTITNLADDEDIKSVDDGTGSNVLKFADRAYNAENFSGKGYKILRKNMVDGKNILTQDMVNEENTVYEVRYDFDLNGADITIHNKCVLYFKGGSLSNGVLNVGDWLILADRVQIFKGNISFNIINFKLHNSIAFPEWFDEDMNNASDSIQKCLDYFYRVSLGIGTYVLNKKITLYTYSYLLGINKNGTNIVSNVENDYCIYVNVKDDKKTNINTPYGYPHIENINIGYKTNEWVEDKVYYKDCNCIIGDLGLKIKNVRFNYFDRLVYFPNYADDVEISDCTASGKDFDGYIDTEYSNDSNCWDIYFAEGGDSTNIHNVGNINFRFMRCTSVKVENSIQCGFFISYSNLLLINCHNESKYVYSNIVVGANSRLSIYASYFEQANTTKSIIRSMDNWGTFSLSMNEVRFAYNAKNGDLSEICAMPIINLDNYVTLEFSHVYCDYIYQDDYILYPECMVYGIIRTKKIYFPTDKAIYKESKMYGSQEYITDNKGSLSIENTTNTNSYFNNKTIVYTLYRASLYSNSMVKINDIEHTCNGNNVRLRIGNGGFTYPQGKFIIKRNIDGVENYSEIYVSFLLLNRFAIIDEGDKLQFNVQWKTDKLESKFNIVDGIYSDGYKSLIISDGDVIDKLNIGDFNINNGIPVLYGSNEKYFIQIISNGSRPSLKAINKGYCHFDTTLNKPIWWTGTEWVDSTGAGV